MMPKKVSDQYSYNEFVWCCISMQYAQYEDRLLVNYDLETKHYFFRMIYPYQMEFYTIDYCPFCGINLQKFKTILKPTDNVITAEENINTLEEIGHRRKVDWKLKKGLTHYELDDFIWCCTKMNYALGECRLLIDYNPANNRYFLKMIYPEQHKLYTIDYCPWCDTNLLVFPTKLKNEKGQKRFSQYFKL